MSRKKPIDDPVVEEVRAVRRQIWEQAGGNIRGLLEWLRACSKKPDDTTADERTGSTRRRSA